MQPRLRAVGERRRLGDTRRAPAPRTVERRLLDASPGLADRLRKGPTDRHRLADRLHGRGQHRRCLGELLEREARDLHDDVVERRLEGGGRLPRDVVRDLVQAVADGEQRGDLRDREAGRLRGEGARSGDPGIHLDQDLTAGGGIDRELHVRPPRLDPDHAQDLDRGVAHPLVLPVGQCLLRGDGDRVAGVYPHRVEVLDRADDHGVVGAVSHHLEFEFLPAHDRLLDEHLADRAAGECLGRGGRELLASRGEPAAPAAQRERRPQDQRVPEVVADRERLVERARNARTRHVQTRGEHRSLEAAAVLGRVDRLERGAEHADAEPVEVAGLGQGHAHVQPGLTAERRQQRVGLLPLEHLQHRLRRERLDVRAVGELRIGHDRRGV